MIVSLPEARDNAPAVTSWSAPVLDRSKLKVVPVAAVREPMEKVPVVPTPPTSIDVPVFMMHGDDDQIVPIHDSALKAIGLLQKGTLKVYPGAPHGLPMLPAYKDQFNADLLAFL